MVSCYLKGSSLYILGVVYGECFGILDVLRFIFEILLWILSCIFEFLLHSASTFNNYRSKHVPRINKKETLDIPRLQLNLQQEL
jgi:hypothetical protein